MLASTLHSITDIAEMSMSSHWTGHSSNITSASWHVRTDSCTSCKYHFPGFPL
jgi:hypothetical protein